MGRAVEETSLGGVGDMSGSLCEAVLTFRGLLGIRYLGTGAPRSGALSVWESSL